MNDKVRIRSLKEIKKDGLKTKSIKIGNDPNLEKLNRLAEEQMQQKNTVIIPWPAIILFLLLVVMIFI